MTKIEQKAKELFPANSWNGQFNLEQEKKQQNFIEGAKFGLETVLSALYDKRIDYEYSISDAISRTKFDTIYEAETIAAASFLQ